MTAGAVVLLQESIGKVVRLTRPDGEVIVAKITLVDRLDEEIVFDMLSTTDESKLRSLTGSHFTYCISVTSLP